MRSWLFDKFFWLGLLIPISAYVLYKHAQEPMWFKALEVEKLSFSIGHTHNSKHIRIITNYNCPTCVDLHYRAWPLIQELLEQGGIKVTIYLVADPHGPEAVKTHYSRAIYTLDPGAFPPFYDQIMTDPFKPETGAGAERSCLNVAADLGFRQGDLPAPGPDWPEALGAINRKLARNGVSHIPLIYFQGKTRSTNELIDWLNDELRQ
jgi:hypothetical protein